MHQRRLPPFSPAHIWPLVVLALFCCLGALVPIGPLDFWWHMALGREIARSGAVPVVDTYSWSLPPDTPFFYQSWLSEWLFYQLYTLGGLGLIVVTRNLLLLTAYTLVGLDAQRRSGSWRLGALAIGGAGLMTLNNLTVRPQMFSWLLFAATWALLSRFRTETGTRHHGPGEGNQQPGRAQAATVPRSLLLVPALMCAWVNLHGAFAIGLALIGLTVAGESLKLLLSWRRPGTQALTSVRLGWLWLAAVLSGAALLVNPRGLEVLGYVGRLVGNPAVRQLVIEWQPTDLLMFPGVLIPFALTLAVLLWLRRPTRFDLTDALLLVVFAALAWRGQRNVIWFGMVAWPIIAGLLAQPARATQRPARSMQLSLLNYGMLLGLSLPLLIVQPPLKATLDLPPVFAGLGRSFPEGSLIDGSTPVAAVAWLQTQPLPANTRLFHDMGYGSYLMWALPEVRVYTDPRIELYPLAIWQRYQRIARNENAQAELASLGATHALLSRSGQPELLGMLASQGSGWTQRYADDQAVFFERIAQDTHQ